MLETNIQETHSKKFLIKCSKKNKLKKNKDIFFYKKKLKLSEANPENNHTIIKIIIKELLAKDKLKLNII